MTRTIAFVAAQMVLGAVCVAQTVEAPEPPQVQAKNHVVSLTLHAVNENGRDAFAFDDRTVAPVIRASPGDILRITYINDLPARSPETCAVNPCMDMTNLHFHGLTVSPMLLKITSSLCSRNQAKHCITAVEIFEITFRIFTGTTVIRTARVIGR